MVHSDEITNMVTLWDKRDLMLYISQTFTWQKLKIPFSPISNEYDK